tara:strand:- start:2413 stop:3015 length:603 start_codon:yes stop_codon:yes gene_type:complete
MKRKIILGTVFIIIFFSFLIFFYLNSNYNNELIKKRPQAESIERENIEKIDEIIESSNIIEDVSYSAKDTKGNEYFLKASEGTIDRSESNYIFLKSVSAIVNLKDSKIIEISSDFGKYNIKNYDTIFSKNVIIKYLDNKISGDYLDFSWEKNFMIISRDVILENSENSLQADVIEVNIKTRDIKIFMYEENKKINIQTSN